MQVLGLCRLRNLVRHNSPSGAGRRGKQTEERSRVGTSKTRLGEWSDAMASMDAA